MLGAAFGGLAGAAGGRSVNRTIKGPVIIMLNKMTGVFQNVTLGQFLYPIVFPL